MNEQSNMSENERRMEVKSGFSLAPNETFWSTQIRTEHLTCQCPLVGAQASEKAQSDKNPPSQCFEYALLLAMGPCDRHYAAEMGS